MVSLWQSRHKITLWIGAVLFASAIGIQFIGRQVSNSPVTADIQAPLEVRQILRKSCYNCHSNEVRLAWFDRLAPASWLVTKDVIEARKHLNFSEIGTLPILKQNGLLFEAVNEIQFGAMPLRSYAVLHPHSRVTTEQLAVLRAYLDSATPLERVRGDDVHQADIEFARWVHARNAQVSVRPSPNGIAFKPDYKDWKTISSTDRHDNNTIRAVLGNEVAIKAIADNHINPWPDGTAFAKVAWTKQIDNEGIAHAGTFYQVEFMFKDSKKYATTKNWGFARWRGAGLEPYGKDSEFANECVDCHTPLRKNDYVFTTPIGEQR